MKPDDKDLSFKASLQFMNYQLQLLSLDEVHYSFVIKFIFSGGSSIRRNEMLFYLRLACLFIRREMQYIFSKVLLKNLLKVKIRTMNCITVFKTRV